MYLEKLTPDQRLKLYQELEATEETLQRDVGTLMEWLEKQPHLPNIKDETFVTNFLLICKNRMEKAKHHLELYYITKTLMPEIFTNQDPGSEEFRRSYDIACLVLLPKVTPEGKYIMIYRVSHVSGEPLPSSVEYVKMNQILLGIFFRLFPGRSIVICDFQNVSMPFVTLLFTSLKKILTLSTKVLPARHEKLIIINSIPALQPIFSFATRFSKKDFGDRLVHWKKRPEDLVEILPKEILPSNYGGLEKPFEELKELWYAELQKYKEWLQEEEKYTADISKCPPGSEINSEIGDYGTDGSFRQINVD